MCDDKLSDLSSKGTGALVDLGEKSDEDFSEVNAVWTQCSLDSHAHVLNHDGTAFAEQRRTLEQVWYRKNPATICQAVQRYNLVVNRAQITDSLEVFAASRSPVVCETSVAFDSKNTDGCKANQILVVPMEHSRWSRCQILSRQRRT